MSNFTGHFAAFPSTKDLKPQAGQHFPGVTKLELFAMAAMQGILASGESTEIEKVAKRAYDIALSTLKECQERSERKAAT